jgi:hypothetical protein
MRHSHSSAIERSFANLSCFRTELHAAMSQSIYATTSPVTAVDFSTADLAAQAQATAASDTMTKAAAASAKIPGSVMVSGGKTGATTNAGTNVSPSSNNDLEQAHSLTSRLPSLLVQYQALPVRRALQVDSPPLHRCLWLLEAQLVCWAFWLLFESLKRT